VVSQLPRLTLVLAIAIAIAGIVLGTTAAAPLAQPTAADEWWLGAVDTAGLTPPGPGKPVFIVDRGLDLGHPDFAGRPDTTALNPQTFRHEDTDGFHATALASIVGAPGRPGGLVGIYPRARIYSWDASPDGLLSTVYVLPGMAAAARRCPGVVLLSFGLSDPQFVHAIENLQEGIDRVVDRGCLVVASAGNQRAQGSPPFYPASLLHVLTVAATGRDGSVAPFSSASPANDLAAPGIDIPIAVPPSGYTVRSGTSYAAAIVAGAAAWLWTLRPTLQASQVAEILRRSARPLGSLTPNDDTGFGLLDVAAALRTPAPPPDQLEPNDDIVYALPLGTPNHGSWPLTTPTRSKTAISASVTSIKDPVDVYRTWVPAHATLTATVSPATGLSLTLWSDQTQTVQETGSDRREHRFAVGSPTGTLTYTSRTARGRYLYLEVALTTRVRPSIYYTLSVALG
jgi:subtilisin family serine protease